MEGIRILGYSSQEEKENRDYFYSLFKNNPLPKNEVLSNLGLFLNRQTLSRIDVTAKSPKNPK